MRCLPFLFLLLMAAHPPRGGASAGGFGDRPMRGGAFGDGHHQGRPFGWRMGSHDGSSPRDFGRALGRQAEGGLLPRDFHRPARLDSLQLGTNGPRLGIGFVSGKHVGFRLRSPF